MTALSPAESARLSDLLHRGLSYRTALALADTVTPEDLEALGSGVFAEVLTTSAWTSGALSVGVNTVDATAGNKTPSLPTPTKVGQLLSVEKTDATTHTVTISGTIRGSSSSLTLVWQNESVVFEAESLTSWRPFADHKTKSSFDKAYVSRTTTLLPAPSGTSDDYALLAAAVAAAPSASNLVAPPGAKYNLASGFTLPADMALDLNGGEWKATAAIAVAVISTPTGTLSKRTRIKNGFVECNQLANDGIALGWFAHGEIDDVRVANQIRYGYKIGDAATSTPSYEAVLRNAHVYRDSGVATPNGSVGHYYDANSTDHEINCADIQGSQTGVKNNSGGGRFVQIHPWCGVSQGDMLIGFDDGGYQGEYLLCYADSPLNYGWAFRQQGQQQVKGGGVFNNAVIHTPTDNTMVAFYFDTTVAGPDATIMGVTIRGQNSSHRIAQDFLSATSAYRALTLLGNKCVNVVVIRPNQIAGSNLNVDGLIQPAQDAQTDLGVATARFRSVWSLGGSSTGITTKTASYTAGLNDSTILVNGATTTQTVPAGNAAPSGRVIRYRNIHATESALLSPASGNIDGAADLTLVAGASVTLQNDGTNWWTVSSSIPDSTALTTGEATFTRDLAQSTSVSLVGSGTMVLTYFTAKKSETINNLRLLGGGTAAGATPTLVRAGIYSVASDGSLTLLAAIANDTSIYASTFGLYTRALTSSFSKKAGVRYAVGELVVTAAAMPTVTGMAVSLSQEMGLAPRLSGTVSGQTDLPSSVSAGSIADNQRRLYVAMTP